jgi:predicted phage-related endonuclease
MSTQRWTITSNEEWLERRKRHVTASVVGGLFGCHPYTSALRLYVEKSGVELPAPASSVLRRGRLLEPAVAAAVAEEHPEWRLEKCREYYFDDDVKIGATPDFLIHNDPRGLGVLQTKTAAPSVFLRDWSDTDPPFWIVLQTLTEAMLTEAAFAVVAVLVVDPFELACPLYDVPRHSGSEYRIIEAVTKFWADVAAGREPGPDYNKDRDVLALLSRKETPEKTIDLSGDNEVIAGLHERGDLMKRIKADKERCNAIEALIMDRMRDAAVVTNVPDFRITWKTSHFKEYTVQARDSRVLRILDRREDKDVAA